MKTCQYCGTNVPDNDFYCPNCGSSQFDHKRHTIINNSVGNSTTQPVEESKILGILSIVFGIIMPFVGLILSAVALSSYKEPENRKLAKIGLTLSLIVPAIIILIWVVFFIILIASIGFY